MIKPTASARKRLEDADLLDRLFVLMSEVGPLLPDAVIDGGSEWLALRTHLMERTISAKYELNERQLKYLADRYNQKDKK